MKMVTSSQRSPFNTCNTMVSLTLTIKADYAKINIVEDKANNNELNGGKYRSNYCKRHSPASPWELFHVLCESMFDPSQLLMLDALSLITAFHHSELFSLPPDTKRYSKVSCKLP